MSKYMCKRNELFILSYHNKSDETKTMEIGPFVAENQKFIVAYVNNNPICVNWKIYKNIFDTNLISIINPKGVQNQKIQTTALLDSSINCEEIYLDSSIIINRIVNSIEVILKMPDDFRIKLIEKDELDIRDILCIYDFVYKNPEILGFNNTNAENETQYKKKNNC